VGGDDPSVAAVVFVLVIFGAGVLALGWLLEVVADHLRKRFFRP
jgi:hypothetical protein